MLAVVITGKNRKDVVNAINSLKKSYYEDLIELRLDYIDIKNFDSKSKFLDDIISTAKIFGKTAIITIRKKSESGFFGASEEKRIELLNKSVELGADYVDVESSCDEAAIKKIIKNKRKSKIIVSHHNFKETPDNLSLSKSYNKIKSLNPDLIKIVTYANSVTDNFKIFDLIKKAGKENKKIIAFCMGPYGEFSRILSIILGSAVTYASISHGKESASSQIALNEMKNVYRIKNLNKNTKIAGLIGNPVEHSWSHIIHNSAFEKLGINAVYLKFRVDKLKEFIEYFRNMNALGFSVTIPHKVQAIDYLDEIDKTAKAIGAINTIVARNKKFIGYNTDCNAAMHALQEKTVLENKKVVILGAGGSARSIAYGLIENKSDATILSRKIQNAKSLGEYFKCNYGSLNNLKNIDYDILINTTPVGMYPYINASPIPLNLVKKNKVVFDIVFNPYKTKLLEYAKNKGCTTIHGLDMLVNGAALQFKLWTNKDAPQKFMRKKVLDFINNS